MKRLHIVSALLVLLTATACHSGGSREDSIPVYRDRYVSIEVEVYDPQSGYVWEDVAVRIVQSDQEWSGCICVNPIADDWYYTDEFGTILFTEVDLAQADVGFLEDGGLAVVSPDYDEDEVTVLLEVTAPGLGTVFQSVDLSWDEPDVFVSIPF